MGVELPVRAQGGVQEQAHAPGRVVGDREGRDGARLHAEDPAQELGAAEGDAPGAQRRAEGLEVDLRVLEAGEEQEGLGPRAPPARPQEEVLEVRARQGAAQGLGVRHRAQRRVADGLEGDPERGEPRLQRLGGACGGFDGAGRRWRPVRAGGGPAAERTAFGGGGGPPPVAAACGGGAPPRAVLPGRPRFPGRGGRPGGVEAPPGGGGGGIGGIRRHSSPIAPSGARPRNPPPREADPLPRAPSDRPTAARRGKAPGARGAALGAALAALGGALAALGAGEAAAATWGWHVVSPATEQGRGNLSFLLGGLRWTAALTAVGFALSIAAGLLIALPALSRRRARRAVNRLYVEVVRSVPLLVLILWVYYGLPVVAGVSLSVFWAGALALALSDSAFEAEIFRAGIQSVPAGQTEAALSLGLSRARTMRHVVLPQALRRVLPPIGNQLVYMLKMSSLVSVVGMQELTRRANELVVVEYRPLEVYTVLVLEYMALVLLVSAGVRALERRLRADGRFA